MLDYDYYTSEVAKLAQYPHANENNIASVLYPALGLNGEAAEVVEKIDVILSRKQSFFEPLLNSDSRISIIKESGDVLWYVTRLGVELGSTLEKTFDKALSEQIRRNSVNDLAAVSRGLTISVGRIAEHVKKTLRDDTTTLEDEITDERKQLILLSLSEVTFYLTEIIRLIDSTVEEVAQENLNKLNSRVQRGVLGGSGDNR